MTIRNQQLKEALRLLAYEYCRVVSALPEEQQRTVVLKRNDARANPRFAAAIGALESDPIIGSHIGRLVGTASSSINRSGESYLERFLVWSHQKNPDFDSTTFDRVYEEFENFFYSQTIDVLNINRLYNFDMPVEEIVLDPQVRIRAVTKNEDCLLDPTSETTPHDFSYRCISQSRFVIEVKSNQKKLIQSATSQTPENDKEDSLRLLKQHDRDVRASIDLLDRVIILLRILKHSSVFRDHRTIQAYAGFNLQNTIASNFTENTVVGEKCELSAHEIEELKSLDNMQDKLLDSFIGLEALYLPDGNQELTFRLTLRIAMSLGTTAEEAMEIYKFVKEMYSDRGSVAHGGVANISEVDLSRLETILRTSVRAYVMDRGQFTVDKLNSVFFRSFPASVDSI